MRLWRQADEAIKEMMNMRRRLVRENDLYGRYCGYWPMAIDKPSKYGPGDRVDSQSTRVFDEERDNAAIWAWTVRHVYKSWQVGYKG